ncbi:phosphatidate cytidylyltransferase [Tenacibaculum sp. S7007]|uniref:Phosphatidate cytidylyltransferase n=1 Tax=Tenacibaculum pelagium TaxID=2759527 RepID=A0A839APQ1_9FLAO|nr:phosphatidate cytidylyltransferase [Tenacibaculum pelagium]MBA6156486.1 phosphatidate cytidylyltransferase [Tenacibaculum pelagium]
MRNLITRSISGLVYAIIFISAILFSAETYLGLLAVFTAICIFEFSKIIQFKSYVPYVILAFIVYCLITEKALFTYPFLLGISLFFLIKFLYQLITNKTISTENVNQKTLLNFTYLILPFFFLMSLPFINGEYHSNIIIAIILIIWTNDSFAYLVGKNFGKHKLFEKVSPKKTIEGFVGGLVFAIIAGLIISKSVTIFSTTNWIFIAIIVSVFGTLGDLVESKFKRQANIKDSGNIMPGHGGLLDRLDSLFFLAPFVYLYIHYII